MSILDRIGKFVQSPTGQGVLAVGAAGFNPLLGILAAPGIKNDRERRQLENQAAREALKDKQRQRDAMARLQGMLGETASLEKRVAGPPTPGSSGPTRSVDVPLLSTPGGRAEALGLLGDAAPSEFGGILGRELFPEPKQQGRLGEQLAAFRSVLGRDPTEEELLRLTGAAESGQNLDDILKRLEVEKLLDEREQARSDRAEAEKMERASIEDTLNQGRNILELTEKLEGTFLEPGRVGMDLRRPFASLMGELAGAIGQDEFAGQQADLVQAFDTFKKDSVNFVINMSDRFGTNLTNFQLQTLQRANAGEDVSPAAIKSVVTDVLRRTLGNAEIRDIEIPEREAFESLLDRFGKSEPGVESIPGFNDLSPEDQAELRQLWERSRGNPS